MNKTISLCGEWTFCQCGSGESLPAKVPGTVCTDLLANGRMEDPFYRDNEDAALAILHNDFQYSRSFSVAAEDLAADRVELVFHGLDTFAQVTLNGTVILQADDMHRTWRVDVKNVLRAGGNAITVRFDSAAVRAKELHAKNHIYKTRDTINGFEQVRKAHCMYGWDWGPQLPDMGIFRPVELHLWDEARITGCYLRQTHTEGQVTLRVETELETVCAGKRTLQAQICAPDGTVVDAVQGEIARDQGSLELTVQNPQLWWPNGYGSQPLYTVRVVLRDGETQLDSWERRIGLRTLTICTDPDQWGSKFEVVVNGVSIFAMGANYIPEDSILSRVSRNTSRKLLEQCVKANYNMIRVWGGGYFQNDEFYDLCDEMGLLVWQDLLFACAVYRLTDRFVENIVAETRDNIRRLRHHACIALWCGNNELEWGWSGWDMGFGNNPYDRADYIKQFEWILPQTARECDPDRFYWLASPSSGGSFDDPNDQNRGDVHYWDVWHRLKPFTEYRKYYFRFCSEFGFQSFPSMKTIESFTLPEDRNIFSDVMECHQKNGSANGLILRYMSDTFLYPSKLDTLVYGSQVMQAEAIKYGVEHWRANRGRCMGALYWQVNDCWPVASWSSIDYYGRWKPLHYYAKKFYGPILCSAIEEGDAVSLVVCSEKLQPQNCTVKWQLRTAWGGLLAQDEAEVEAPALGVVKAAEVNTAPWLTGKAQRQSVYLAYQVWSGGEMVYDSTLLFAKPKHFRFEDPHIRLTAREEADSFVLTLTAEKYAKYVWLESADFDFVADDNCVDLLPGVAREIRILKTDLPAHVTAAQLETISTLSAYDIR